MIDNSTFICGTSHWTTVLICGLQFNPHFFSLRLFRYCQIGGIKKLCRISYQHFLFAMDSWMCRHVSLLNSEAEENLKTW